MHSFVVACTSWLELKTTCRWQHRHCMIIIIIIIAGNLSLLTHFSIFLSDRIMYIILVIYLLILGEYAVIVRFVRYVIYVYSQFSMEMCWFLCEFPF